MQSDIRSRSQRRRKYDRDRWTHSGRATRVAFLGCGTETWVWVGVGLYTNLSAHVAKFLLLLVLTGVFCFVFPGFARSGQTRRSGTPITDLLGGRGFNLIRLPIGAARLVPDLWPEVRAGCHIPSLAAWQRKPGRLYEDPQNEWGMRGGRTG